MGKQNVQAKEVYWASETSGRLEEEIGKQAVPSKRVSMGLSAWRETSKKLTVCREKRKKLTDNRVVCGFS